MRFVGKLIVTRKPPSGLSASCKLPAQASTISRTIPRPRLPGNLLIQAAATAQYIVTLRGIDARTIVINR